MQVREKVVAIHCVFRMICGSGGSRSRLAKAAGAEPFGRWEMKNCTQLWHEAHLEVKKIKALHVQSTFGSWDVEKVHAVVAQSIFWSQHAQNTPRSEHLWKLRCSKSASRCGGKQISKSKVQKTDICKTHHVRSTFGRSTAPHYTTLQIRYNTTATTTAATTPLYYAHTPLHHTLAHFATTTTTTATTTTTTTATTATATTTTWQLQLDQLQLTTTMQLQLQLQLQIIPCTTSTPHYIQQLWLRWPLQPQPPRKAQLRPPFGPSMDLLCHPCITTTDLPYSGLSLKLPPPPCAVLLLKVTISKLD